MPRLIVFLILLACAGFASGQSGAGRRTQQPRYSPDGKYIVFSSAVEAVPRDTRKDLRIMKSDGTQVRTLTTNATGVFDEEPSVSPDGKVIAFIRRNAAVKPETSDLYVINLDGSGLKRLTSSAENEIHPEFTSDSSSLLFIRKQSSNIFLDYGSLHLIELQTAKETQVLGKEYQVTYAVPAPRRGLIMAAIAKSGSDGKPLDIPTNGNLVTAVSPTGEIAPSGALKLPPGFEKLSISKIVAAPGPPASFILLGPKGMLETAAFRMSSKGLESVKFSTDYHLSPDGAKVITRGGGDTVYVKAIGEERGESIGTR